MIVSAVETPQEYVFTVQDGTSTFLFSWGKEPTEGQTAKEYIQNCKREAELLAMHEIAKLQPPQEINL